MVKNILIMIILATAAFAQYDYIANDTQITFLNQTDTDQNTTLTYLINSTPGEYEISALLGEKTDQIMTIFSEGQNEFELVFNKVLPGEKDFFMTIYRDDALIVLVSNMTMNVDNNVELKGNIDNLVATEKKMQIVLNISTNLDISNSTLTIRAKNNIYESGSRITESGVVYEFEPTVKGEYFLEKLDVEGYVLELNESLGTYDFNMIQSVTESKTNKGLVVSFSNLCECDIDFAFFGDGQIIYNGTALDSVLIPNEAILNSELNGPYTLILSTPDLSFEYTTNAYNYTDFNQSTETPEETESESSSGSQTSNQNQTETTETNQSVSTMDESTTVTTAETENKTSIVNATKSAANKLTGFVVSTYESKPSILWASVIFIILVIILLIYIKQRKDAYLYEI